MANQANNQRLNGLNPLSYLGVDAYSPANLIIQSYSPTANDSSNVQVGAWWLNSTTNNMFYLASLSGYTATWIQILSAANNLTFTALTIEDGKQRVSSLIFGSHEIIDISRFTENSPTKQPSSGEVPSVKP